ALSLSSTAIVLPTLAERKRLHIVSGRTSFAVLLFQDLAVAPLLLMASVLSFTGTDLGSTLVKSLAPGVVAVVALAAIGRLVLRPMFRWVAAARSTELFMGACLLVILGTASVTAAAGQSMALGAFICGLLLAETEFRRQIEALIKPFEGLLLGLFFLSVGAQLDIGLLLGNLPATLGIAAGLIVVKAAAVFGIARVSGLARSVARGAALTLAGGGEFAFVLLSSTSGGVVPEQAASAAIAAVTLSMLAIPLLIGLAERLDARTPDRDEAPPEGASGEGPEAPVIIAGYGRVGTLVGTMLARHGIPFVAIDDDIVLVRRARRQSASNVFFGDATNPELLRRCGVQEARAVVVTMTSREAATAVVIAARAEDAELPIVARAMDPQHAKLLYRHGATEAVPEDIEPSLYLSELVLVEVGVPMGPVIASIHDMREEFRVQLRGKGKNARPRRAIRASSRPADPPAEGDPADGRSVEQVT
ncbi:MAG: cation:proton antiporter, partial [Hansschlegelia sp.]